jgi:ABC-type polysaccharide/polyol phosphate transport system ATPase subunit
MGSNLKARLADQRIGVFGKGGAGKSTAVVLLAKELRQRGYEVYTKNIVDALVRIAAGVFSIGLPGESSKTFGRLATGALFLRTKK